ncbi:EAL domain-containing protein [Plantactinospora sp. S1510]|uniref:EAL domain-containing protein n=1 Tax=Plantactinospora alkalitolerans TaxID=2789879 RepID=A0ABS0H4N9_9ACTN|nr:EAL domain-containing protein [Plantactinospora alkalitolerans]MBF9133431.1 EAL domain-containing protein [Plantactinospora alkalitolerans]
MTDAADGPGAASAGLDEIAQYWARLIARISYVPVRLDDLRQVLRGYAARLAGAGAGQVVARDVGAALVADGYTHTDAVQATIAALADRLPIGPAGVTDRAALLGGVAAGYARALRERTQSELESIIRAVLTARRSAEQARAASEARFEALFVSSASGICVVDLENRIVQANPALARMLDRPVAELDRRRLTGLSQPDHRAAVERALEDLHIRRRAHAELDAAFSRPDGGTVWLRLSLAPVRHDAMAHLVVTAQDDTERYHLQSALSHQALHDPLTNLPNRTLLLRRLDELAGGRQPDEHIGICYLDLDGFKTINDSFGHAAGDDVLRTVAGRLAECVAEPGWLAGRLGGDEFVIVAAAGTELDQLVRVAERVVSAVREPIPAAGHQLSVSVSIGVTDDRIPHSQPSDLMRAADIALYWAKAAGGDRYEIYDPNRHDAQALRSTLSSGLRSALQSGDFALRYQPIVRLADGVPIGAEVLLRWTHPEHGPIAPEIFIDLAEELGLIGQLGRWVLTRGCREAAGWYRELGDRAPFISVNLSARQLHDVGLADELLRTLDEVGLPAHQLQLELTESALLGPAQGPADALEALAEHGVRVAVDDFGTGYSNLAYLRRLPVRELKIAGSFIEGLAPGHPSTPADRQIVASVIALAHGLNLTVTAEGVETEEQAHLLRTMGCDHAQGWWFARPGDPEVINRMAGGRGGDQAGYSVDPVTTH